MTKNKHINNGLWLLAILLLGISFLIHSTSYFNTKEINSASSQCYEVGGQVILKIYNNVTNTYYFECKPN
ncbi:hypothetical protein FC756_25045 [Lysinibacillus mangiferihumi]|uniref:Uncharacterized protein n=1 Tax=Lysinibacillus mangiferihumi TaxID=1130819 RepID=A0A4U2XZ55_9BACI|nr:hypothetical protein [Lysinibacillus mangiferihumi]TKI53240.1 hypothetical protein FC756_25045 [Lysinibacillus mangiferihumi]